MFDEIDEFEVQDYVIGVFLVTYIGSRRALKIVPNNNYHATENSKIRAYVFLIVIASRRLFTTNRRSVNRDRYYIQRFYPSD